MALRNPSSFLNPLLFFVISISLFPIAISPESQTLSNIAPGIIWVTVMLSALLSLNTLFHFDYENGILVQTQTPKTFMNSGLQLEKDTIAIARPVERAAVGFTPQKASYNFVFRRLRALHAQFRWRDQTPDSFHVSDVFYANKNNGKT